MKIDSGLINQEVKSSPSFKEAINKALSSMSERSQRIIRQRWGLDSGEPKTLEEIGKEHKITRERVRQIIREVLRKIREAGSGENFEAVRERIVFTIEKKHGIIIEKELVALLCEGNKNEAAALELFLECFSDIKVAEVKNEIGKSRTSPGFKMDEWLKVKDAARLLFEAEKRLFTIDELAIRISNRLGLRIEAEKLADWLKVSEEIKKNNFGKWGISQWEEVAPKNTREKAYLVLKEEGEPLHFTEITQLIDKYKLNSKKTHPQTVHNELIKDNRFVLVGRGTYALSEWGYKKGTVKEIIEEILRKKAKPIGRDEILNEILKVRKVKKSTVMINLNNSFARVSRNEYTLKKQ